ncbi:hypothetical protein [Kosakonia sp. 1610]|uniref:hypothetical protein n=1 Tax=Kosakonia sp. 1610 TaxID=3156426 RepID=UPI003D19BCAB
MKSNNFSNESHEVMEMLSEAILISWCYKNQSLEIHLTSYNDDEIVLTASTDTVISEAMSEKAFLNTCRIEIINLKGTLEIENGYYMPCKNFNDIMKWRKLSFLYGRDISFAYCISFVGFKSLLTFPVKSLSDITFGIK